VSPVALRFIRRAWATGFEHPVVGTIVVVLYLVLGWGFFAWGIVLSVGGEVGPGLGMAGMVVAGVAIVELAARYTNR
jgi:hypothetical protein